MDLTNYRIDPAKFALACVQSSPDLTTEDKLRVFTRKYMKKRLLSITKFKQPLLIKVVQRKIAALRKWETFSI